MRRRDGGLVGAVAVAAVISGVIAYASMGDPKPSASGDELRRAARRALVAAGGEWATIGPGAGGTWEARVRRADLSRAVVVLDDHFEIVRVYSTRAYGSGDPRSYAAAPSYSDAPVYVTAQASGTVPEPPPARTAWSPVSPADAERAARVALEAVGGGTVNDVDRESEGGSTWEVEITTPDGRQAEVQLDAEFRVLRTGDERDWNEGPDDRDESGPDNDD